MAERLDRYVADARQFQDGRAADPAWLVRARREALDRFQTLGFPSTRDEEWRFTSIAPLVERPFELAQNGVSSLTAQPVQAQQWSGEVAATLVFVNGHFAPAASTVGRLPEGVRVESLTSALADSPGLVERYLMHAATVDGRAFTALNTAFLGDGAFVFVPDSTTIDGPIHLLFLARSEQGASVAHPRVLVVAGARSRATIVESYASAHGDRYFTNAVTEIIAGEGAVVDHYKVQREAGASFHMGGTYARAGRDANVSSHGISFGGAIVRNDIMVVLDGEGAYCTLNGLYVADGSRLVDTHTTIDHAQPHCGSREIYKGILADHSRAVFNGRIIVRPDAQQTDAKQTNKALLLSEDAQIHTQPQLEIFANDVKCTHGAAVGQMDEEAIFYLRARGFSEHAAREVLIKAFAGDVLNHLPLEPLRARLEEELAARLPEGRR
jgi:Fe-S cluster assembly protein SufD